MTEDVQGEWRTKPRRNDVIRLPYLSRSVILFFVSSTFVATILMIAKAGYRENPIPRTETIVPFIFLGYLTAYRTIRYAQGVLIQNKNKISCHFVNMLLALIAWGAYLGLLLAHSTEWGSLFSELAAAFFALLSIQALHQIYLRLKPSDAGPLIIDEQEATSKELALTPFGKTK